MIETGFTSAIDKRIYYQLCCSYCGHDLGCYEMIDGKEYNDIEGWNFCPYCGRELEQEEM